MSTQTEALIPTPSQTVGPFFAQALPYPEGNVLVPEDHPDAMLISGQVLDGAGEPVPDALVEIWQAGPDGRFPRQPGIYRAPAGFRGFGRCGTNEDGQYWFRTVKPAGVPTADGRPQAPHLGVAVLARGLLVRLATRLYFPDEPVANAADPLLTTVDPDRRGTLIARANGEGLVFDIRLQGDGETVFLDVAGLAR